MYLQNLRNLLILIEPQWNVDLPMTTSTKYFMCILIEPQWNVDFVVIGSSVQVFPILIEPQWNVDWATTVTVNREENDFNRTIVECRLSIA